MINSTTKEAHLHNLSLHVTDKYLWAKLYATETNHDSGIILLSNVMD